MGQWEIQWGKYLIGVNLDEEMLFTENGLEGSNLVGFNACMGQILCINVAIRAGAVRKQNRNSKQWSKRSTSTEAIWRSGYRSAIPLV